MKKLVYFGVILLAGLTAAPANAWHQRGHMTVALLAYRELQPPQQKILRDILRKHPHFEELLTADRPADASMEEWMVVQAAIWPDWVRRHHTAEFHKPLDHFVNLPIRKLEGATEAQKKQIEIQIAATAKQPNSLLTALPKRLEEVQNAKDPVALCWILHLVGDIHQPLHAATLFTKDSPRGDEGGNQSFVRRNNRAENLHSIWDGVVGWDEFTGAGNSLTEFGVVELMTRHFKQKHPVTNAQRKIADAQAWAKESVDLADTEVYSSNGTPVPIVFNFDRHHHMAAAEVLPLPAGYESRARGIAEARVALAGARLADQLKAVLR